MIRDAQYMNQFLQHLIELLDIPPTYYKLAEYRYKSLGKWFHRKESSVADFDPKVYPQGSFRYGTVIRPLIKTEDYDLDLVCELELSKGSVSQKQVKELVGNEVKAYAEAHNFKEPAQEKKRCWRLDYADDVNFHMDILPAIQEDELFISSLVSLGITKELADHAVSITDNEHANYDAVSNDWPRSNPKGFAGWFEHRMKAVAMARAMELVSKAAYASVDEVPSYEWKTPLQRSIQILKRHRDVMFCDDDDFKPISMIITTLSAHAYQGETELWAALSNIVERMPDYIRPDYPRVPNPVNPKEEDFADKWAKDDQLERSFWEWHTQVKADLVNLRIPQTEKQIIQMVNNRFDLELKADQLEHLAGSAAVASPIIAPKKPEVRISTPPKPWNRND